MTAELSQDRHGRPPDTLHIARAGLPRPVRAGIDVQLRVLDGTGTPPAA